ncbi:MAG: methylenetetrahydrofolate reductase C-terminal domain-containing protein [Thermoleophilia bacterium]|nr:methylenetetrahydrofolate reductase C-terminal domain-containing protein [Actinomycetota bacterium]
MIITKQKPIEDIIEMVAPYKHLFFVGCGQCSTQCQTGGEWEIEELSRILEEEGHTTTGSTVVYAPCHELDTKRHFRKHKEELERTDAVLVMSCGAGVQSAVDATDLPVFPTNDSLFLGNSFRHMHFEEKCSTCGECVLQWTGGICPVTRCPKGLLNGPCGGTNHGRCEVDSDKPCAWVQIYQRLESLGQLDKFREIRPPKNYAAIKRPGLVRGEAAH